MATAKSILLKSSASREAVSVMGRAGYGARGAIYLMVGISAGRATLDPHHPPGGFTESLKLFQHHWSGGIVLALLAIGMACFASWLAVSAVYRRDHPGPAHWVLVAGLLGDACIYLGFMASVLGMIFGAWGGGGSEHLLQEWVRWLVAGLGGRALVGLVGAGVFACGAGLVWWGGVGDIEGPLELPPVEKRLMLPIGRYGTGGRGVAIALVGFYLFLSAIQGDASRAHELGGALNDLRALPYGVAMTGAFALAFIGSSVLDFAIASFRRFDPGRAPARKRRRRRGSTRRSSG
ncbi:MAG TPA: DUF1206 domain-containing protein [Stellaceae bacterium]|nr:DUF1206 domain-containing protein [Stellaceae bacterium]